MSGVAPLPDLSFLELEIDLEEYGNAFLTLKAGGQSFVAEGSYVHQSFHDLLAAAINLEIGLWRRQIVQFELEPGELRITLNPQYHTPSHTRYVKLVVEEFENSPGFENSNEPGISRFTAYLEHTSFSRAVLEAMSEFASAPEHVFEKHWGEPFPQKGFRALAIAIETENRSPVPAVEALASIRVLPSREDND